MSDNQQRSGVDTSAECADWLARPSQHTPKTDLTRRPLSDELRDILATSQTQADARETLLKSLRTLADVDRRANASLFELTTRARFAEAEIERLRAETEQAKTERDTAETERARDLEACGIRIDEAYDRVKEITDERDALAGQVKMLEAQLAKAAARKKVRR